MIYILTTRVHTYTHTSTACGEAIGVMTYDDLFSASAVPMGTWIFTDFDRLGFWELELAARVYQELKAAGARVLNNPALVKACEDFLEYIASPDSNVDGKEDYENDIFEKALEAVFGDDVFAYINKVERE